MIIRRDKLEAVFDFIRIANRRGGYLDCGEKQSGLPSVGYLLQTSLDYTHLPEPTKTEMMQMWREERDGTIRAFPVKKPPFCDAWSKVGEPFDFTYPEEDE